MWSERPPVRGPPTRAVPTILRSKQGTNRFYRDELDSKDLCTKSMSPRMRAALTAPCRRRRRRGVVRLRESFIL